MKKLLLLLLVLPAAAQSPPALVNHKASNYGPTTAMDTTGTTMYAVCSLRGAANPPTDSSGDTFTLAATHTGYYGTASLFVAFPAATATNETFQDGGGGGPIAVMVFSGVASGPDQTSGTDSGSPVTVPSITPTRTHELVAACLGPTTESVGGASVISVSPLALQDTAAYTYGTSQTVSSAYAVQSATPTASAPVWTITNNTSYSNSGVQASFYAALDPAALTIGISSLPNGNVSVAYSQSLEVNGGTSPYTCTVVAGSLPPGLSITNCVVTGTPTTVGTYTGIQFKVTDAASATALSASGLSTTIYVAPPVITTSTCPGGTQLTAYTGTCVLAATGGAPPYTFQNVLNYNTQGMPEGMVLNASTGAITSGYLYAEGGYAPTFTVTDSNGSVSAPVQVVFAIAGNNTYGGTQLFPSDSIWHARVDTMAPAPTIFRQIPTAYQSVTLKADFGSEPGAGGIPVNTVPADQASVGVQVGNYEPFTSGPIPCFAGMEGTISLKPPNTVPDTQPNDNHVLTVEEAGDGHPAMLYEIYYDFPYPSQTSCTTWNQGYADPVNGIGAGYFWALNSYTQPGDDSGGTTDAAGMPVAPLMATYDEVLGTGTPGSENGVINHPIRFTMNHSLDYHVTPASARSGSEGNTCTGGYTDPAFGDLLSMSNPPTSCEDGSGAGDNYSPMGEIFRIIPGTTEPAACASNPTDHIFWTAFVQHGIILADNGGTGYVIGTNDSRWQSHTAFQACFSQIPLSDFEGVNPEPNMVDPAPTSTDFPQAGTSQMITSAPGPAAQGSGNLKGSNVVIQ